ncbi:MAG: zinc-binding protein [Firmicutes bacterium]|nr:zinc-binding protein [Bacillota bacterium]HXL03611.1 zinc-ribbon domain containing protein [Bacillota bacterium]
MYQDKTLVCKDCGREFSFSASEQEFFASKGYGNEPGRCPACRSAKRGRERTGRHSGGVRHEDREMHSAVCARCGAQTSVPFKPRPDRPVYCRDCYQNNRSR